MVLTRRQVSRREHDAKRSASQPWRAWYSSPEWTQIKADRLARQPWCERHLRRGQQVRATVVNQVGRYRGERKRFFGGPFESVCKPCHDSAIQRDPARGVSTGVDLAGRPTGPDHPWNRKR